MSWLMFWSKVIESLAWPVALLFVVLLLRGYLGQLFKLLNRVRYGDLELNFGNDVESLQDQAVQALPSDHESGVAETQVKPDEAALAAINPRAAIVEAWIRVSQEVVHALRRTGKIVPKGKMLSPRVVENAVRDSGLLDENELTLLRKLRNTRNAAVHDASFHIDEGYSLVYVSVANRLIKRLNSLQKPS